MRIRELLESRSQRGEKSFVAYLTAGDPTLAATEAFVRALARGGADIVELGVPHSDPVADGPTNLKAAERGLASGTTLSGILDAVARLRAAGEKVPIVIFSYLNPILRLGLDAFAERAARSGVDAVLVVDLPAEESEEHCARLHAKGVGTIFLASPTTRPERLARIDAASSEFVYYVSRTGVTGTRESLSSTLGSEVAATRSRVKAPLCVGFGISTPEQSATVAALADGVIVGSAFVKIIEARGEHAAQELERCARTLSDAAKRPR